MSGNNRNNRNYRNAVTGQNPSSLAPAANPVPAPANNNQQANQNNSDLVNNINRLITRAEGVRDPLIAFISDMNTNFITPLKNRIQQITNQLAQLTIDDNNLSNRIVSLRDSSVNARAELDRLNNQLQQSQQQYRDANEAVARLQGEVTQGRDQLNALETARADLERREQLQQTIINDANRALERLSAIIGEIENIANQRGNNQQLRDELNASLDSLNNLVTTKLEAYQRIMGQLPQQGGKRRTKKYKKMRGGYSYPSAGYEGAQEIVVTSSRSARSRSARSRRQSKRRPRTI